MSRSATAATVGPRCLREISDEIGTPVTVADDADVDHCAAFSCGCCCGIVALRLQACAEASQFRTEAMPGHDRLRVSPMTRAALPPQSRSPERPW